MLSSFCTHRTLSYTLNSWYPILNSIFSWYINKSQRPCMCTRTIPKFKVLLFLLLSHFVTNTHRSFHLGFNLERLLHNWKLCTYWVPGGPPTEQMARTVNSDNMFIFCVKKVPGFSLSSHQELTSVIRTAVIILRSLKQAWYRTTTVALLGGFSWAMCSNGYGIRSIKVQHVCWIWLT